MSEPAPEGGSAPRHVRRAVRWVWKKKGWVGGVTVGVLIGLLVTDGYEWVGSWFSDDPAPIAEQLTALVETEEASGGILVESYAANLRGFGKPTRVIVLRDRNAYPAGLRTAQSDEIRLYDEVDGRLKLSFAFVPTLQGEPTPFLLRTEAVDDLDENGRDEIVGALYQVAMGPVFPRPILIQWNAGDGRYVIRAIIDALSAQDALRSVQAFGSYARGVREEFYGKPTVLIDKESKITLRAYAVEDYLLTRANPGLSGEPPGAVLVAAYVARAQAHCCITRFQIAAWPMRLITREILSYDCTQLLVDPESGPTSAATLFETKRGETLREALRRVWADIQVDAFC